MALTVQRLITQAAQLANRVDSSYNPRLRDAISRAQEDFAQIHPWPGLRRVEGFVVPGGRFMTLPLRVQRIISIHDLTDNRPIDPGGDWSRTFGPRYTNDTTGAPVEWRDAGIVPLFQTPVTDTRLELTATVSETYNVNIQGLARDTAASGTPAELYEVEETLQMAGTGATDTATTFVEVRSLQKGHTTTGDLIVKATTGGQMLARIPARDSRAQYRRIEFQDVPGAGRNLRVEYYTRPETIVDEEQALEPAVDEKFILWRVVGDLHWMNKEAQAAQVAWAKADAVLAQGANAERVFGERLLQPLPWCPSYDELENVDTSDV